MNVKYIVGRPFRLDGTQLAPGDELTASQVAAIPRLESWVSMRFLFRIHTGKDYGKLPPYLFSIVSKRAEARAKIERNTRAVIGPDTAAQGANEAGAAGPLALKARAEMSVQEQFYAQMAGRLPTQEVPVVEQDDPAEAVPQQDTGQEAAEAPQSDAEASQPQVPAEVLPDPAEALTEALSVVPEVPEVVFDPAEHTVARVKKYLAEHPEDSERVLAAERAGKARATLLEY